MQGSKGLSLCFSSHSCEAAAERAMDPSKASASEAGNELGRKAALIQNASLVPSKALAAAANQIPAEVCAWLER